MLGSQLKVGFIGGGKNSAVGLAHKIALEMDDKFKVVSGCFSRDPETNEDTACDWGIEKNRVYTDWKSLLEKEKGNLDAIVIVTPTPTHKDIIVDSIKAGFPVICEKALVCSSEDALEIKNILNEYNGHLSITYNYTGYPMLRELKSRIDNGELGNVEQVLIEMPQEGFLRLNADGEPLSPQDWRLKDNSIPTVSLDLGVHLHQLIDFLTGEKPLSVAAVSSSYGNFKNIIDTVHGLARYSNEIICNFWYGKTALGYSNGLRVRIFGESGSAEWYQLEPEYLYLNDNLGVRQTIDRTHPHNTIANLERYNRFKAGHPAGFIEAFANYYSDIADDLNNIGKKNNQNTYVFGINVAIEGLRMLEAIQHSTKEAAWCKIN